MCRVTGAGSLYGQNGVQNEFSNGNDLPSVRAARDAQCVGQPGSLRCPIPVRRPPRDVCLVPKVAADDQDLRSTARMLDTEYPKISQRDMGRHEGWAT